MLFSGLIYITTTSELEGGLSNLGTRIVRSPNINTHKQVLRIQTEEVEKTRQRIISYLVLLNICVFILGGITSYLIAWRTLNSLEVIHKAQARFSSDASHELRTPLAAMKSELEATLYNKKSSKTELKETINSTLEEVDKMTGLTSMLLDLSHVNTIQYDTKPVEVNHAIQSVVDRLHIPQRLKLQNSRPAYIKGSEVALESVFNIIIDNALKYSTPDTPVTIEVGQTSNKVNVKITNEGEGINEEDIEQIFEHFYRGKNSTDKKLPGYGMGLALAKEIITHHGGRIDVKSTTGKLTIFTVVLPKNGKSLSVI